jgi:methyl-accepting chemotaxis protein
MTFRSAISKQETMDAATIAKDNCCALGQWLYGEGKTQFGQKPEFAAVVAKHKVFHTEAGRVAQLINAKKYAEAEQAIAAGSAYSAASSAVGGAIVGLKKIVD